VQPLCAKTSNQSSTYRYVVIQRGGDKVGDNTFGLMVDKDGKGLEKDGKPFVSVGNGVSLAKLIMCSI
jgi:hypothetical protein